MQVKIGQLRNFDAIVRLGSFVEAAKALHVTPAALSLSIRELEDRLGFAVLERTTRRLRLTEAGRGYLPFVQRVLTELEDADRFSKEVQQGHAVIRIATTQAIIGTLLAAALPDLHAKWPRLRVHPLDVATIHIPDALASRQADLAIGVGLSSDDLFESKTFFASSWYGFLAASHPLARRKRIAWSELLGTRLFMSKTSRMKLEALIGPQTRLTDVQDTATIFSGFAMASTGLGVAIFPGYARAFASIIGVRCVAIDKPRIPHELQISAPRQPMTAAPLHEIRQVLMDSVTARCSHLT